MQNIKSILSNHVLRAYQTSVLNTDVKLETLLAEPQTANYLKIVNNKPQSDYKLAVAGLHSFLCKKGLTHTVEEIASKLINELPIADFDYLYEPKSKAILINLQPDYAVRMLLPLNQPILTITAPPNVRKQNILVEFSSPNIAKDMHVGHLRSTIIGDSIAKLLEFQQHNVLRINHIGDFGLQFGMIIEYLLRIYPNYEEKTFNIEDLQTFYALSKKEFDSNPEFARAAYEKVVLLQTGDPYIVKAWNYIKDVSRQAYNEIYEKLDITLTECGESFYQSRIPDMIAELEKCDPPIMVLEEGRKIIRVPGESLVLTVQKSDGGYTYDTTDLAAVRYRLKEVTPRLDRVIYVVDSGQAKHFDLIFWVANQMGWLSTCSSGREPKDEGENQSLVHVGFGLICGPDGKKFKSRSGDTVKLKELLDDSLTEARKMIRGEHTPDEKEKIAQAVAYGSLKYADLRAQRIKDYNFSTERMLSLKGNTGVYQLYEYVRICSIFRKARENKINEEDLMETFSLITLSDASQKAELEKEMNLCTTLLIFPEIIEKTEYDFYLHTLCDYLYTLSDAFSQFHTHCRVLSYKHDPALKADEKEGELMHVNKSRLLLCLYTKKVMEKCLNILGLRLIEKM